MSIDHEALDQSPPPSINFVPAFSPRSRYLLRNEEEGQYFRDSGGAPEALLIQHAASLISPDDTFVDVGAHIGTWSQHLSFFCKRVLAFEPQKAVHERLLAGIVLAKIKNVQPMQFALGSRTHTAFLSHVSSDGGGATIDHRPELGDEIGREPVSVARLDDLVVSVARSMGRIGLMKLDVEGHEIGVIQGATDTLEEHDWPPILAEAWLHDWYRFDRAKLIHQLQNLGYTVWPHALTSEMLMCERRAVTKGARVPVVQGELPESVRNRPDLDQAEWLFAVEHDLEDAPAPEVRAAMVRWHEPSGIERAYAQAVAEDRAEREDLAKKADPVLLTLVMIVKDEEHGLEATLRSFLPFVDRAVFVDTGSTDGTRALIARVADEFLAERQGVKYEADRTLGAWRLFDAPFHDFSQARNAALDLARDTYPSTFTIMPDADDRLTGGHALRAFLTAYKEPASATDGGFMVNMFWGGNIGDFYLPLVLRQSVGWRYKGPVHEYIDGGIPPVRIPAPAKISKHGNPKSAEATRARWERDEKLLAAEVIKNPNDPRSWFYLAQTLECLGKREGARTAYRKRATLGGFRDEHFEALIRIARITKSFRIEERRFADIDKHLVHQVIGDYLECHTFDPTRCEPLYELADFHLGRNEWALAYLFGARALGFILTESSMMVNREAYEWQNSRLVAIAAFYLARDLGNDVARTAVIRATGKEAAELAVRARPHDQTDIANRAWYAPSAATLFDAKSQEIDWKPEAPYNPSNPSIHFDAKECRLRCILRTVNYKIVNGQYLTPDDNVIFTKNVMLDLDPVTLKHVGTPVPMVDLDHTPRSPYPVHGFEDCRLFMGPDGALLASATVCDFDPSGQGAREIVLLRISPNTYDITEAIPMRGPWSAHPQKNWMPVLDEYGRVDQINNWVYSVDPLKYVQAPRQWKHGIGPPPSDLSSWGPPPGRLRGGSQLIWVPEDVFSPAAHIALVHEVAFPGDNARIYLHRFIEVRDGKLYGMTEPFYFNQLGIEFAAGLALIPGEAGGGRLAASYAVNDYTAFFATFDLGRVRSQIEAIS